MSEEVHPAWWKPWNWSWRVWALAVIVMLALLPFVVRTVFLSAIPAMAEPFDVAEFVGDAIPPDENAFTEYRQAYEMRKSLIEVLQQKGITEQDKYSEVYKGGWDAADEAMRFWMEEHRPALAVWRRGTEKQRAIAESPATMTFATTLEVSQNLRAFVRLAMVDQMRCLHEGNVDEAWKLARAAYRSGGHVSRRGTLISALIGIAFHAMSADGMKRWAEHPAVTADQLRAALAQVKADFALYESESNMLRAEYLALRNSLMGSDWLQLSGPVTPNGIELPATVMRGLAWVVGEPELTVRAARQIVANQAREVDKPRAERRKLVGSGTAMVFDNDPTISRLPGELDAIQIDRSATASILAKLLLPGTKQADDAVLRFRGRQAALEVMLAAQAYRRDKGEFPENLDQLVPQYLEAVPLDPCDPNGGRILYRHDPATSSAVWSVGPEGNISGSDGESENRRSHFVGFMLNAADSK